MASTYTYSGDVEARAQIAAANLLNAGDAAIPTIAGARADAVRDALLAELAAILAGTATSALTLNSVAITGLVQTTRSLLFQTSGVTRASIVLDSSAESGSDAGSSLILRTISDVLASRDVLTIPRSTASPVSLNANLDISAATGRFRFATSGRIILSDETVTYSTSMTPNAAAGNTHTITITDGVAMAINAPTSPTSGQIDTYVLRNTSGGAAGACTWNAVFKLGAAWAQGATGFSRSIQFRYNGTNWVELFRSAADVAN